jgi:nitroreductase
MQPPVLENIFTRRSIRRYLPKPLPREILEQIVKAGTYAPSARNSQPWHFTVVTSPGRIDRITEELKAAVARMPQNHYKDFVGAASYSVNFRNAPVFIIVSGDAGASIMIEADCALALGNMFLAAHALGVGSCWVNQLGPIGDEPGFRAHLTALGFPESHRVIGGLALGRPDGPRPPAPPRRSGRINVVS